MRRRLLAGIGANLYGQAATTLIQLAAVPLLLASWGPTRYGAWTLLSALPAALTVADGGLVLASGNAMAMLAGRGDHASAAALYRRSCRHVGVAVAGLGLIGIALVHLVPASWLPILQEDVNTHPRWTLDLLLAATLLGVLAALPPAALRADGAYARAIGVTTTIRLAESSLLIGVVLAEGGLLSAAAASAGSRLLTTPWLFALARRRVPWLGLRKVVPTLPSLMRPAAAALLLPACFALSLQGVTLAVGLTQPPSAVAAFTAARTLSRALVQAVGLVIHALMPEMAHAAGRGDAAAAAAVLRLGQLVSIAVLGPGWLLLLVAGPAFFAAWTGGRLSLPPDVLQLVASAAALHGLWLSRANLLLAVNRQGDYALAFFGASLASVVLAAVGAKIAGLSGAAAALLIGEAAMLLHLSMSRKRRLTLPRLAGAFGR